MCDGVSLSDQHVHWFAEKTLWGGIKTFNAWIEVCKEEKQVTSHHPAAVYQEGLPPGDHRLT